MAPALFTNGIYESVLEAILDAQEAYGAVDSYLQPHSGQAIRLLRNQRPSAANPVRLYASTTDSLSHIGYTAMIVGWADKRKLSLRKRNAVSQQLSKRQPGEVELFAGGTELGKKAVNLITIRSLQKLDTVHPTSLLRKVSDGSPLKQRTQAGGWSVVYDLGDLIALPSDTEQQYNEELSEAVAAASKLSDAALRKLLRSSPKHPARVQLISVGYRRNPHVIVAVLRRARGNCELCGAKAPFLRRSDGSPFLEVHHLTPLSQGGDDTIENAAALCPNCHRKVHFGFTEDESGTSSPN